MRRNRHAELLGTRHRGRLQQTVTINSGDLTGQYLIVAASLTNTSRNDDFKIASVDGKTIASKKVPEPSTLALFGTAGLIAFRLRRRKQAARRG